MKLVKLIILTIIFTTGVSLFSKPSLFIFDFDISRYPYTSSRFMQFGETSVPLANLRAVDYLITNNANSQPPINVVCPEQSPDSRLSLVLSLDLAAKTNTMTPDNFTLSKRLAKEIVTLLDTVNSNCAITGYGFSSFLYQEFTNNRTYLSQSLDRLDKQPGATFDAGLSDKPAGALAITDVALFKKSIILITDGYGSADVAEIVKVAVDGNIRICFAAIDRELPISLKEIALATGGGWVENIGRNSDITAAAKAILALAHGYKSCEMDWYGALNCDLIHYITVSYLPDQSKDNFSFSIVDDIKPTIESSPPFLGFSSVLPFTKKTLDITLTAKNDDVTVHSMSIPNPRFEIKTGKIASDTILRKGEPHQVFIEFSPQDSAIIFTQLNISASACFGKEIFITGGFPNTPPREKTLDIKYPNCGETLIVGDTAIVEWTGLLPKDVIQLEYSINNGIEWDTLAKDASGLFYKWTIPNRPSRECLVRAVQLWPNNIGKTIDLKHKGRVNAAFFNKIGNLAVTTSVDTTAVIWDANNGDKLFTLKGHSQPVLYADFDLNGLYSSGLLVTSSADSTAIMWHIDINKPEPRLVHRLIGHRDIVWSCKFSPDGRYIVTSSRDGKVMIWNVSDGSYVKTVDGFGGPVYFAVFSPDNKYVLTGGNDGFAKMFDWVNNPSAAYKSFDTRFGGVVGLVYHADFNHDGTKIVTSSMGSRRIASVWNVATTDTLFTVTHNSDTSSNISINYSSFFINPTTNNEYILTAGDDEARLWSVDFPTLPYTPFREHTSSVRTAVFNFDGMRVLTSSWDSTAKIWNLDQRDLQMDTSDCNFRIAMAIAKPADVVFGDVALSEHKDSLILEFLINDSDFEYQINKIEIAGGNSDDFTIISGNAPYMLDSLGSAKIEIRFKPLDIGLRQSTIHIKMPGNEFTALIQGNGIDPGLQAHSLLEFNQVELGDFKDLAVDGAIKNRSLANIQINKISIIGPDTEHFSIVKADYPVNLVPGAEIPVTVRFVPEAIGRKNSRISIEHTGKGSPAFMNLFGEGVYPNKDTITIFINSIEGAPGDIVELPIYVGNAGFGGIRNSITGMTSYLRFNSTMLEPLGSFESDAIDGIERVVKFSFPLELTQDSVLGKVKFKVGLGNDTLTTIFLENSAPMGTGKIKIYEQSAIFKLKNYCTQGGARLIDTEGKLRLAQNAPNPFSTNTQIEFEIIENGQTKLDIVDFSGRIVKTLIDSYLTKGAYSAQFDAQSIPAGAYYYILTTPTRRVIKTMVLEK